MRALIGIVLLLVSAAVFAQGALQASPDGQMGRITNVGRYYIACEIVIHGRTAYWELYPGQSTAWYRRIDYWRCR